MNTITIAVQDDTQEKRVPSPDEVHIPWPAALPLPEIGDGIDATGEYTGAHIVGTIVSRKWYIHKDKTVDLLVSIRPESLESPPRG